MHLRKIGHYRWPVITARYVASTGCPQNVTPAVFHRNFHSHSYSLKIHCLSSVSISRGYPRHTYILLLGSGLGSPSNNSTFFWNPPPKLQSCLFVVSHYDRSKLLTILSARLHIHKTLYCHCHRLMSCTWICDMRLTISLKVDRLRRRVLLLQYFCYLAFCAVLFHWRAGCTCKSMRTHSLIQTIGYMASFTLSMRVISTYLSKICLRALLSHIPHSKRHEAAWRCF